METHLIRIGILALQGAFREHAGVLERLGVEALEVRRPEELEKCDGLILPGGETTTQRKLAKAYGFWEVLDRLGSSGFPMLATCAGLILLARSVDRTEGGADKGLIPSLEERNGLCLDLLDIDVTRNAYGRQVHSFEVSLELPSLPDLPVEGDPCQAIFIRAPRITRVGKGVFVLCKRDGEPVAVQQGNVIGLCFHPELTPDDRFHRYFIETARKHKNSRHGEAHSDPRTGKTDSRTPLRASNP